MSRARNSDPTKTLDNDRLVEPPPEVRSGRQTSAQQKVEALLAIIASVAGAIGGAQDWDGDGERELTIMLGIQGRFEETPGVTKGKRSRDSSSKRPILDRCFLRATDGRCVTPTEKGGH